MLGSVDDLHIEGTKGLGNCLAQVSGVCVGECVTERENLGSGVFCIRVLVCVVSLQLGTGQMAVYLDRMIMWCFLHS